MPPALFEPAHHEKLTSTSWSDAATADAITRIAEDLVARFDPDALWPTHPVDEPKDADPYCMLYFGAPGGIHALRRLAAAGTPFMPLAFGPTVAALLERNRLRTRTRDEEVPSPYQGHTPVSSTRNRLVDYAGGFGFRPGAGGGT